MSNDQHTLIVNDQDIQLKKLTTVFFISGFSALIYQVAWQRLLFSSFGVDLESVTIIISIFMAGLGLGAFYGGRIADRNPNKLIAIFSAIELSIGAFGLLSPYLIFVVTQYFIDANTLMMAAANFCLLVIPTFLMGITLPLLTYYFNLKIENIGESIGRLYIYNTIGAAMGALSASFVFFNYMTVHQVIYLAAALNIFIAIHIFISLRDSEIKI